MARGSQRGLLGSPDGLSLPGRMKENAMASRKNIKNEKQYEGLKKKGMSKQRAAKIANSPGASSRGGKKTAKKSSSGGSKKSSKKSSSKK